MCLPSFHPSPARCSPTESFAYRSPAWVRSHQTSTTYRPPHERPYRQRSEYHVDPAVEAGRRMLYHNYLEGWTTGRPDFRPQMAHMREVVPNPISRLSIPYRGGRRPQRSPLDGLASVPPLRISRRSAAGSSSGKDKGSGSNSGNARSTRSANHAASLPSAASHVGSRIRSRSGSSTPPSTESSENLAFAIDSDDGSEGAGLDASSDATSQTRPLRSGRRRTTRAMNHSAEAQTCGPEHRRSGRRREDGRA